MDLDWLLPAHDPPAPAQGHHRFPQRRSVRSSFTCNADPSGWRKSVPRSPPATMFGEIGIFPRSTNAHLPRVRERRRSFHADLGSGQARLYLLNPQFALFVAT